MDSVSRLVVEPLHGFYFLFINIISKHILNIYIYIYMCVYIKQTFFKIVFVI